jgi:hypothetical protein
MSPISRTAVLTLILIGWPLWPAEAQSKVAESPAKIEEAKKEQLKKPKSGTADPHKSVVPKPKPSKPDSGSLERQREKRGLEEQKGKAHHYDMPDMSGSGKTKEKNDRPGPCEEERANRTRYQKCLQEQQHKSAPKQELKPTPNPTH